MTDISLNTAIKIDGDWHKVHINDTRLFYVDVDGQATSGESLPALVDELKKRYKDVKAAFQKDYDQVPDQGCIFHSGGDAPEFMKDYRVGARTAQSPPASPVSNATRSICDSCVFKIIRMEDGLWSRYDFDASTKIVIPKKQ